MAKVARRWANRLNATLSGDFACYEQLDKVQSSSAACFGAATEPFQLQQTALATVIHTARPVLQDACSQLATAALRRAGSDDTNLALTEQLESFLILCTPRGSASTAS